MDITNLDHQLKQVAATTGCTLNIDERHASIFCFTAILLTIYLIDINSNSTCWNLKKLKISMKSSSGVKSKVLFSPVFHMTEPPHAGIVKDYYVALGLRYRGQKEFPQKLFYWANSGFVFAPLPAARGEFEEFAKKLTGYFTGEHEKVLQAVPKKSKPAAVLDMENDSIDLTVDAKDFTELDRLAYVVRKIERDTHVVPQGAFKLAPIQEIRKADGFKGLEKDGLANLAKYQHFRPVETAEKKEQLERNEGVLQTDIFDSLASDKPKDAWSVQVRAGHIAAVKSLLWPGYSFYHLGMTGEFWGVYIGDGVMNKDLPFML